MINVNDNFDCWHLGFRELVEKFIAANVPGIPIIRLLAPEPEQDFYVLKPSHSGFLRTGLEVLLSRLETQTLVLTGFAGDICVLFTANDAYMRGFDVIVPAVCIASEREADNAHALHHMARILKGEAFSTEKALPGSLLSPASIRREDPIRNERHGRSDRLAGPSAPRDNAGLVHLPRRLASIVSWQTATRPSRTTGSSATCTRSR